MNKDRLRRDRHGNLYVIEGNTVYPIDDKNHRYPLMTDKDGNLYFEDENGQIRLQKDKKNLFSNHSEAIAIIIAAIIGLLVVKDPVINAFCSAISSENATIICSQSTPPAATLTAAPPTPSATETLVSSPEPSPTIRITNTPITIDSFCAFLTFSQVSSLQQIQDAADAIRRAEEFAGFRQNDYQAGDTIPENVVIATNIYTTNFDSVGVIPINNSGGYGLFLTTQEIVASYPGTYWCVRDNTPVVSPVPILQDNCNLESPVTPFNSTEIIPDWRNSETTALNVNIPDGYDTLYVSSDPAIFNGFQARERLIILSQSDIVVEGLTFNPGDGHFNIWAVAFSNCSIEAIFERYGLDGTNLAWFIDSGGRQTQYYP